MSDGSNNFFTIKDKLIITADIKVLTGMHIGASNDFSPIGAVDSVVVKDPLTGKPIIPGSSIKGKLRTVMAKIMSDGMFLPSHENDKEDIKKLFGSSVKNNIVEPKLQFYDLFLKNADELYKKNLDLGYTEIKFENTINRVTAVSNPRQLERVPAGAVFEFKLIYNADNSGNDKLIKDFELISNAIKALQLDYIGGNGTRGYGKISFYNFSVMKANLKSNDIDVKGLLDILKKSENFVNKLIENK